MADCWDFKAFYADLIEHMPVLSIRRKMKEDEELKRIVDSDKCMHIAFDERKIAEDRDLEIFFDDLLKYLLFMRLNITDYRSQLKRKREEPIPNICKIIGMSVLCYHYRIQKNILVEIIEYEVGIENLDSIATFFTNKALSLHLTAKYSVFEKLQFLACITLELSAYFHLRGNESAISFAVPLYFSAFQHIFKKDFYANGGWNSWSDFASENIKIYENERDFPAKDTQMIKEWITRFDRWFARLPDQTESALNNEESSNQSENSKNFHDATTSKSKEIPDDTANESELPQLKCLFLKDCPAAKQYRNKSDYLIIELIDIISREKDPAYEDIFRIIEKDACVTELMRYCIFTRMITLLRDSKIKMRNIDILQCMKQMLQNNGRAATYCFCITIEMHRDLDETKSFERKDSEGKNLAMASENLNEQKVDSNTKTVDSLSPVKKSSSSVPEDAKNILDLFLDKIKGKDKHCTSSVSEICKILADKATVTSLLGFAAFRKLVKIAVCEKNRWEDEWILSVVTFLINNLQTNVFMEQSTIDDTRKTEYLTNEASVIPTNPQLTKSVSRSLAKTARSSVSISDCEDIDIEQDWDDITKTEQVENLYQNLSFSMCQECFNCTKLRLVQTLSCNRGDEYRSKEN